MTEEISELDEVVINAGTFEASDKKKSVLLKLCEWLYLPLILKLV